MNPKFYFKAKYLYEALLLVFVFLLPWQTRWIARQGMINGDTSEYLSLSIYGIDIFLVFILLLKFAMICREGNSKFQIKNFKSIFNTNFFNVKKAAFIGTLFVLWNVLSIFWASDKLLAAQHGAWMLLAAGLVWMTMTYENKTRLIFWFIMGLMVSAWLGIWQFATQTTFANKWMGLALHKAALGGTSVVETFFNGQPARWLRAYGSFDHPNIFAMAMTVGILLIILEIARMNRGNGNEINGNTIGARWKYIAYYLALVSMSAGLFASLSRSAWAGLAIGVVLFGIFLLRNKNAKADELHISPSNYFMALIVIAVIFLMMGFIYKNVVTVRTGGDARLERKSLDDRVLYLQQAKKIISQNSFIGVGAGNYVTVLQEKNPDGSAWTYQPVHNVFTLVWAELGMVGLLAFAGLCVTIGMRAYQNSPLGFCLLLAFLPTIFLDHWLWSLHVGVIFLGVIFGITLKHNGNKIGNVMEIR